MEDLVIDTNVLMHTINPTCKHFGDAIAFAAKFNASKIKLCIDEGYNFDEAKNTSKLTSEYLKHLVPGSLGYQIVVNCGIAGRIKIVPMTIKDQGHRNFIKERIPKDSDKWFAKVAYNSSSKTLVSHDERDFSPATRDDMAKSLGVTVAFAAEIEIS